MTNNKLSKPVSRRDWFTGSAAVLGAGAISPMLLEAQSSSVADNISLWNFALRLENLQAAFYQQGLAMFKPSDFQNSAAAQAIGGTKVGANLYSYIRMIAQQEQDHVNTLIQAVAVLDGTPQAPDCYSFGLTTADSFLEMAQAIENISVMAYNGVTISQFQPSIGTVQNAYLLALAATIATVEARHAAYFNLLNFAIPFPAALDGAQTMQQILSAIGQYLTTGCNPPPVPLTLAVAGPAKHSVITTTQATVQLNASLSSSGTGKPLTYLWEEDLGSPNAQITNPTSVIASAFLIDGPGEYSFSLRVVDTLGNSDSDNIKFIYKPS
jgi:hypothetical protein